MDRAILFLAACVLLSSCATAAAGDHSVIEQSNTASTAPLEGKPGLWESIEFSFRKCWKLESYKLDGYSASVANQGYLSCVHSASLEDAPRLPKSVAELLEASQLEYLSFRRDVREEKLSAILTLDAKKLAQECAKGESLVTIIVAYGFSRIATKHGRSELKEQLGKSCYNKVNLIRGLHIDSCHSNGSSRCRRGVNGSLYGILSELDRYGGFSR